MVIVLKNKAHSWLETGNEQETHMSNVLLSHPSTPTSPLNRLGHSIITQN